MLVTKRSIPSIASRITIPCPRFSTGGVDERNYVTTVTIAKKEYNNNRRNNELRFFHSSNETSKVGLFGLEGLNVPSDFKKLSKNAICHVNGLQDELSRMSDVQNVKDASLVLRKLDEISNAICSVIDAAELCRCVHSEEQWRDSAQEAYIELSNVIAQLNATVDLYETLNKVTSSPYFADLTKEEQIFASLLKKEFERDGIHLPQEQRQQVQELHGHIVQLESLFTHNLNSNSYDDIYHISDPHQNETIHQIIPSEVLSQRVPQHYSDKISLNKRDAAISNTLLKFCDNPSIRKEVYIQSNTVCPQNINVLKDLLQRRHELANLLKFPTYSHFFLQDKLLSEPRKVQQFLQQMQKQCQPNYFQELNFLSTIKQRVESTDGKLDAWDIHYYVGLAKQLHSNNHPKVDVQFSISQSIQSLKLLVSELFDIQMIEESTTSLEQWHDSIRKFSFTHSTKGSLGVMYLDLFPRPNKYGHAAHFTVRCGCRSAHNNDEHQLPIIALVCNFNDERLSHSEVETLFHEFGHALHSLLSRTTFQHLSGTRAAMDFIETPSHLMEYYVWDPTFLYNHLIVSNNNTLESIETWTKQRYSFASMDVQQQIVYSLFDQSIHSSPGNVGNTTDILHTFQRQCGIPYSPDTHWHSTFGHLVTYGSGYYSYLYASVFAADIWQTCFQQSPLARSSGTHYWNEVLRHGGSKDPNLMITSLLHNRSPQIHSFFRQFDNSNV